MEQKPDQKIKAFTLRKKTSKAGKEYYVSPYGEVDLFAFQDKNGDIVCFYSPRTPAPVQAANRGVKPASPEARPKITPRPQSNYQSQSYAPGQGGFKDHTQGGWPNTEDGDPGPGDFPF